MILVVVNAAQIESVLFGSNGVFSDSSAGSSTKRPRVPAVMICSTIAPDDTERLPKA